MARAKKTTSGTTATPKTLASRAKATPKKAGPASGSIDAEVDTGPKTTMTTAVADTDSSSSQTEKPESAGGAGKDAALSSPTDGDATVAGSPVGDMSADASKDDAAAAADGKKDIAKDTKAEPESTAKEEKPKPSTSPAAEVEGADLTARFVMPVLLTLAASS